MTRRPALLLLPFVALAACEGGLDADLDASTTLERDLGVDCIGTQECSGEGDVYTSAYRVGATATASSELLQPFTATASGAPARVLLVARILRPFASSANPQLRVKVQGPLTEGIGALDFDGVATVLEGSVDLAGLPASGVTSVRLNGTAGLVEGASYALRVLVDGVGASGSGSVLVGIGAIAAGSTAPAAHRAARRTTSAWGTSSPARFRPAGAWPVAFAFAGAVGSPCAAAEDCSTGACTGGTCVSPYPVMEITGPSGSTIDFGSVNTSSSATRTITLRNAGSSGANPLTVATSGLSAPYTVTSNDCTDVAAGASCSITVQFAPLAGGVVTRTLTLTPEGGAPATFDLTGTGVLVTSGWIDILPVRSGGHAHAAKVTDTRLVAVYTDGALDSTVAPTSLLVRVLDRSGDAFAWAGEATRLTIPLCKSGIDQCIRVVGAIGPAHVFLVTTDSNLAHTYRLLKITGSAVSLVQTIAAPASEGPTFNGHPLDDTRYLMSFRESGGAVRYRVITRSGDTFALGTPVTRPSPSAFGESNEPQTGGAIVRIGASTFREIRSGYVWTPGTLSSWVLTVSGSTLTTSSPVAHTASQSRTMTPLAVSDGTDRSAILYPSYNDGWHSGSVVNASFNPSGSISGETSTYDGGQSIDSTDGYVNGAFHLRPQRGTLYRFATVSSAPTVVESGLFWGACYHGPSILKSGGYGLFLTCGTSLRLRFVKL